MRKTLTYSSFIAASLLLFIAFVTATNYIQLGLAVLFYPLLAVFAFKVLPRNAWRSPIFTIGVPLPVKKSKSSSVAENVQVSTPEVKEGVKVSDIDKRAFLKLIGGAGLSFFVLSLLNRRAGGLLFGSGGTASPETVSIKDTKDRKIDPAEKQATDGYRISQIDDNLMTYYGFTDKQGAWFIMREDTDTGAFRYAKGDFNFSQGWDKRENLNYGYFNEIFK